MQKINICPSILSANFYNLSEELGLLKRAGVEVLHFDVMDGHFVPNISFGSGILKNIADNLDIFLDVHLMVSNPTGFVEQFFKAGANSITFHIESDDEIIECIKRVKYFGCRCGVAISPKTSVEKVFPYLDLIDMVLVMTVNPGFGGQSFLRQMLKKVEVLKKKRPDLVVEVDGGVNLKNIKSAVNAGASWLVVGSHIFSSSDILKAVEDLKNAASF